MSEDGRGLEEFALGPPMSIEQAIALGRAMQMLTAEVAPVIADILTERTRQEAAGVGFDYITGNAVYRVQIHNAAVALRAAIQLRPR